MSDAVIGLLRDIGVRGLPTLAIVLVAVWIGKLVLDLLTRYKVDEELTGKNNAAVGVATAGYFIGLAIAITGVVMSPVEGTITFGSAMLTIAIYSIIAIILLSISAFINDKLILYKFNNNKELVDDQNAGTGATMFGSYVATGLIVNAAVSGEVAGGWLKGLLACLVFFALGQVVLVLAGLWYQLITKYDIHKVIGEDNNVAAGIGFGGFLVAMGYVLRAAMMGESKGWGVDLISFALYVVIALVLLSIATLITDKVFLPKAKISDEIGAQGNIAAASIAAAVYIAVAVLIVSAV